MMTSQEKVLKINKFIFLAIIPKASQTKLNNYVKSYSCPIFNTKTVPNNDVISGRVKFIKSGLF